MIDVSNEDLKEQVEVFNVNTFQVGDLIQFDKTVEPEVVSLVESESSDSETDVTVTETMYAIIGSINNDVLGVYLPDNKAQRGIYYSELSIDYFDDVTNIKILNRDKEEIVTESPTEPEVDNIQ